LLAPITLLGRTALSVEIVVLEDRHMLGSGSVIHRFDTMLPHHALHQHGIGHGSKNGDDIERSTVERKCIANFRLDLVQMAFTLLNKDQPGASRTNRAATQF
jgi:hypothetical protein